MANLLNRIWSRADFWDKEENERQKQQFAQQRIQQQQTQAPQLRPGGRGIGIPQNQAQNVPEPIQAPKQSVLNKIRDIVDPNTEADKFRRSQKGKPLDYQYEQKNFAEGAGKNLAKSIIETGDAGLNATRYGAGLVTRNRNARDSAARQFRESAGQSLPGQIYKPAEDMVVNTVKNPISIAKGFGQAYGTGQQGSFADKLARVDQFRQQHAQRMGITGNFNQDIAAPAIETGLNILSMGQAGFVGSQFGKQLGKDGFKTAARTALPGVGVNAGLNTAQGAAMELYNEDPTLKGALQGAATGATVGTLADLLIGSVPAVRSFNKQGGVLPGSGIVNNVLPPKKLTPDEAFVVNQYNRTKGTKQLTNEVYYGARAALDRAKVDHTNTAAIDNLLSQNSPGSKTLNLDAQPGIMDRVRAGVDNIRETQRLINKDQGGSALLREDGSFVPNIRKALNVEKQASTKVQNTPDIPVRRQAGLSEDEFFQRFNPDSPSRGGLSPDESLTSTAPVVPSSLRARNQSPQGLAETKQIPSRPDMLANRAGNQIETPRSSANNTPISRFDKSVANISDPEFRSLVEQAPSKKPQTDVDINKQNAKALSSEVRQFKDTLTPIKQVGREKNIPVRKVTREGDVVTKTNVNPKIKAGEKRFSVDDKGELIPDKKGATSLFTDDEGRVTGFRVGNETFSPKDYGSLDVANNYGSVLASQRRNIERAFGKESGAKAAEFLVDHQQEQATKMITRNLELKNQLQDMQKDLGINFAKNRKQAKKVSAAIQDFGEKNRSKQSLVDEFGQKQADKIVKADKTFKQNYDKLLNEMNDVLTQFGYDPVPRRKNYYTHFQDENLFKSFGLKMQEIRNQVTPTLQDSQPSPGRNSISNKLAGESEFTVPNKAFNKFALKRTGDTYTSNAFEAFERYLSPTLNNIYMTPSIARARVLARAVAQDADIVGKPVDKILVQTKEWANNLAGKSNRLGDRQLADTMGGPKALNALQFIQRKAGGNTIVGNLSTAVMQPILLAQTAGKAGYKNTILGALQEMSTAHGKNAPIRQSSFLKRRYTDLSSTTDGKLQNTGKILNKPLEVVEETAVRISWNAAHNDALSQGLKGKKAIQYADIQTEKTVAGRSIGERPELYRSKVASPVTMYQLEVNNYWQQVSKEMTKKQAAKTMVAAYGLNLLLQEITGRSVGFNPIDAAINAYQETQKEEKPVFEKAKSIGQRFLGEAVDNTPLVGPGINLVLGDTKTKQLLGKDSNIGRFGVGSPLSAVTSTTKVGGIPIPQNLALPFGGGQLKKTIEGAQTLISGGVDNKKGERQVDVPRTPENIAKGLMFGKGAIPEVNKYYNNIGRKKYDQSSVPNQLKSVAGGQGLEGLTKEQQEILNFQVAPGDRETFKQKFLEENKTKRQVEKEVEDFKKNSSGEGLQRSDGKFATIVDGKVKTFDSKADYEKGVEKEKEKKVLDDFKNSKDKTKVIGDRYYFKKKNGDVSSKPVVEYEYDKTAQSRKLKMDTAYETNNLEGYVKLAQEELDGLEKLKSQYDPDTEQDKIDALTLKQQNLEQKAQGYINKGYTKRGRGGRGGKGGKGKKTSIELITKALKQPDIGRVKKSNLTGGRMAIPTFARKTPRVAKRGTRNTRNVSSRKVNIV